MVSKLVVSIVILTFGCFALSGCAFHFSVGADYHGKTGADNNITYKSASNKVSKEERY